MPRKTTTDHPLRKIRQAAGLTQAQLAARIGVTDSTVEKWENKRRPMSHEAAVKIRHQLGCHIVQKTDRDTGKEEWTVSATIMREDGRPTAYTAEDYEHRQEMLESFETENGPDWQEGLTSAVTLLLQAATRAKRLPSVAFELEQAIGKLIDAHKLEPHLVGVLRDEHEMEEVSAKSMARAFAVIPAMTGLEVLRGDTLHPGDEESGSNEAGV